MAWDSLISSGDLGKLLGLSDRRIQQLTQDGVFENSNPKEGGRSLKFKPPESVQSYVEWVKEQAAPKSSDLEEAKLIEEIKLKGAKATIADLERLEVEGQMHRADDVEEVMTDLCLVIRSSLLSLPGRLGVDLAEIDSAAECSAKVKAAVCEILDELSNYQYDPAEYQRRSRERMGWREKIDDESDD